MNELERNQVVSWLVLERYALGELGKAERARVERALESDPATRACLELIQRPIELPPIELGVSRRALGSASQRATFWWRAAPFWPAGAALAAAALVLLLVRSAGEPSFPSPSPTRVGSVAPVARRAPERVKGDAIALSVVREHEGQITTGDTTFAEGDRFKVLLTCPAGSREPLRIVVEQSGSVASPLVIPPDFGCGNAVALPGAFTLTQSAPARLCVQWGASAVSDMRVPLTTNDESVCLELVPSIAGEAGR